MSSEKERRSAFKSGVDIINATAKAKGVARGEVALELLRLKKLNPVTKQAALIVRTKELVKQNRDQ